MKTKNLILTAVLLLVFAACSNDVKQIENESRPEFVLEQPDEIDELDYQLYSMTFDSVCYSDKYVIHQKSSQMLIFNNYLDGFKLRFPEVDENLCLKHIEINATTVLFDEKFKSSNKKLVLISEEESDYMFNVEFDTGWDNFYNYYKDFGGIISFTKIAYNDDKTEAIFEVSNSANYLAGTYYAAHCVKQNNTWILNKILIVANS